MKEIVKLLKAQNKTISTMESCTGGAVASSITDNEGASSVLKFSAVTYSNEYKIKMGIDPKVIEKYTVYSMETAMEMSKNIAAFAHSNYGIGITGQMYRLDENNVTDENNVVYISIYDKDNENFYNEKIFVENIERVKNKELVIKKIIEMLNKILKKSHQKVLK